MQRTNESGEGGQKRRSKWRERDQNLWTLGATATCVRACICRAIIDEGQRNGHASPFRTVDVEPPAVVEAVRGGGGRTLAGGEARTDRIIGAAGQSDNGGHACIWPPPPPLVLELLATPMYSIPLFSHLALLLGTRKVYVCVSPSKFPHHLV